MKKIMVLVLFVILGIMINRFIKKSPEIATSIENALFRTSSPVQRIGNDEDEHGCIESAGYTWCESKSSCVKILEDSCSSI